MYLVENPVLQRELIISLRQTRAFALLGVYVALLGVIVLVAWPQVERVDLANPAAAQRLVNLFFLGQYLLVSLLVPSFTAGSITGEKERQTYEMLLASPLTPAAVVLGKLAAALCLLGLLVVASLPIVVLCLPLGGVSFYEVLAAYFALMCSTITFGMIGLAASSYFRRTAAALMVSYLMVLPLALVGLLLWYVVSGPAASYRLVAVFTLLPLCCAVLVVPLYRLIQQRLLYPPDIGSEGRDVIDEETEQALAVGLVIQRGQFPDNLFAPAKRTDLLADGANPVFDKEMRSEIFSQGTLMLRVVIQVSMLLAVPLMGWCLYLLPWLAPWYVSYVLLFNVLVGPVFSAGAVTSERERETLDLLLTTILSPGMILWPKLVSGLRVSSVLTLFLVWPLVLACAMVEQFWGNLGSMLVYLAVILISCLTTATLALFCSVVFRKTSASQMAGYLAIVTLYLLPLAVDYFARTFFPQTSMSELAGWLTVTSPFATVFRVPLTMLLEETQVRVAHWPQVGAYFLVALVLNGLALAAMRQLFEKRWRVAQ